MICSAQLSRSDRRLCPPRVAVIAALGRLVNRVRRAAAVALRARARDARSVQKARSRGGGAAQGGGGETGQGKGCAERCEGVKGGARTGREESTIPWRPSYPDPCNIPGLMSGQETGRDNGAKVAKRGRQCERGSARARRKVGHRSSYSRGVRGHVLPAQSITEGECVLRTTKGRGKASARA